MTITTYGRVFLGSLFATTLLGGAAAYAQTGPVWDQSQLPETKGWIKQYTLTPRGDVDGLILTDGTVLDERNRRTCQRARNSKRPPEGGLASSR